MSARELLAKARRAAASAKLLLEAGDADGACNRAYYAMRDAARAALRTAEEIRLIADYKGDAVEREQAVWAVDQASVFVAAMQAEFLPEAPDPEGRNGGGEEGLG